MVPEGKPLISVSYKYNARMVLFFIVTADAVSTKADMIYLSNYPEPFSHVSILPVNHPLCMSKFFVSVNGVDSHNKSRQSDLALEKVWVTGCGWLRLCTTVPMGIAITNFWKIFIYGVKIDKNENFIVIRELLEQLALDCFNNPFSADSGTPAKNIPLLDEVDGGETVSTLRAIHFYSYAYHYT